MSWPTTAAPKKAVALVRPSVQPAKKPAPAPVKKAAAPVAKAQAPAKKAKGPRPPARLTLGITTNGKYNFSRFDFQSVEAAIPQLAASIRKHHGKGLREVILSIHK